MIGKLDEDAEVEEDAEAQSAEAQRLSTLDRRAASDVGRTARLELVFSLRRGRTVLTHGYAEPPFRIGAVFQDSHRVRMILPWSAPGVFGGDCLEQRVRVERGASVRLASQSALQAHPTRDGAVARIRMIVEVEEEAELRCEWDPLIPFPGVRLSQRNDVRLASAATLYWSDALMAGREGRGERWVFRTIDHELAVSRNGTLTYLERYCLEPATQPLTAPWVASDCCYFGSVLFCPGSKTTDAADKLQYELSSLEGVRGAVDTLDPALTLVRLMASRGIPFHEARAVVRRRLCA